MKIEFFKHSIDENDIKCLHGVLKSIFLTTGKVVKDFEDRFSSYISSKNVIGLTSCTAALHLGLIAWNVGEGDEVITTPLSFCATANAILQASATPVFVDVEEETGNMNAELIEDSITEKTRAIMPVHLYGQMCDMKRIREIADKHNLVVIEDAAHCIEGIRDGIKVGQHAEAACFSFYATKNITSGEGGAIATNDNDKAELLKMLRIHGINKEASDRYTKRYEHWDMPVFGWKYNMDNIQAALLVGQLERIDQLWERRNRIWNMYEEKFRDIEGVEVLKTVPDSRHARHMFTIQVAPEKRDRMLFSLQEMGIGVAVNYRPIHLLQYYRKLHGYREGDYPVAEKIGSGTISLPLYPKLSDQDAERVIAAVAETIHNL